MENNILNFKKIPLWDLSDLYSGINDKNLIFDMLQAEKSVVLFKEKYKGKLAKLNGDELAAAIIEYEHIDHILSKIISYAELLHATAVNNANITVFYQDCQQQVSDISLEFIFFTLELNKIDQYNLDQMLNGSSKLAKYKPWLRDIRVMKPHLLNDDLESLFHEKQVTGQASWVRLFDETLAGLRFPFRGKELSETEILDLIADKDEEKRHDAVKSLGLVLSKNISVFSLITNILAKEKAIEDKWRKFDSPISSRNLSNHVEDQVVNSLITTVKSSYSDLSHRYYKIKAQWLNKPKLNHWDRMAPLPDEDTSIFKWEEARDIVLDSYQQFSPELAKIGKLFFDNDWIDARPYAGKSSGAFAHPTVVSSHPYLLVNYLGKTNDIMTLSHELGHGIHQILASKQGHLMSDTPLTLAETASVFGEMLTFKNMLNNITDKKTKRAMLASKIEDMLNTVVRQVAFCEFERHVHQQRKNGELSADKLGDIWMKISRESLGDAIILDDDYKNFWAYIPHFIHTPFYVYSYAFGDCLVNSLYAKYQDSPNGFPQKYFDMLSAGGSLHHKELLSPFGLDASDDNFWQNGLNIISGFIDDLEKSF